MHIKNDKKADVIVIGAGTIGSATAYYLTKKKIGNVMLIDRGTVGSGATSWAASLLTQVRKNENTVSLVQETYRAIEELKESGLTIGEKKVGSLQVVSSEESKKSIENLARIANSFSLKNEWISPREVKKKVPWINSEIIKDSLFMEEDLFLDAHVLANAYAEAAKKLGVQIKQNTEVVEITHENDTISGVKLIDGSHIESPIVVDAAGAWSNLLSIPLDINLPLAPVRSIYWITKSNPVLFPANQPMTVIPDAMAYTRPESGALLFGIRDKESKAFNPKDLPKNTGGFKLIEEEAKWDIIINEGKTFQSFFPDFDIVEIAHSIVGLSTYTVDSKFVVGAAEKVKGFYVASGCVGAGVATSAGFARVVSEMIAGQDVFMDVQDYAPERLGKFDSLSDEFMNLCSLSRSNKRDGG